LTNSDREDHFTVQEGEYTLKDAHGNKLDTKALAQRALKDKLIKASGTGKVTVNRKYDVPYLAGSSLDGKTVYIDKRIPQKLVIKGKAFDPSSALVAHEEAEHKAMMAGKSYATAHKEDGLPAEKKVVDAAGVSWSAYQEQMHKLAEKVTEPEKTKNPPPDLYLKPYPHREAEMLEHEEKYRQEGLRHGK